MINNSGLLFWVTLYVSTGRMCGRRWLAEIITSITISVVVTGEIGCWIPTLHAHAANVVSVLQPTFVSGCSFGRPELETSVKVSVVCKMFWVFVVKFRLPSSSNSVDCWKNDAIKQARNMNYENMRHRNKTTSSLVCLLCLYALREPVSIKNLES